VKKVVICALAVGGFAVSAQAADLGSTKDPLPDTLSYAGVTLYGTVDVGYAYQTNGAPQSGYQGAGGLDLNEFSGKQNREAISALSGNGLSSSLIGLKVEENVGAGFVAIAKLDTFFNPWSGELSNSCAALAANNNVNGSHPSAATYSAATDSSRCGQALNGQAYAGLSNAAYGTLTIGRQNALDLDLTANYDPLNLSSAFSLLGYSGTVGGGVGTTEAARWDNSVKYVYQYGPVHGSVMYSSGGEDTAIFGHGIAGNVGATWNGFSLDAVYTSETGTVSASTITASTAPSGNWLNGTIVDNNAITVAGKYTYDFGGSFKDEGPSSKLTLFAGYQRDDQSNSSASVASGEATIGGYQLFTVNTTPYGSDRILQTEWAGAKYDTGPWSFIGAYYHFSQDQYTAFGTLATQSSTATKTDHSCAAATAANITKGTAGVKTASNCSGDENQVSGVVDYTFNKHFDVYTGVSWSEIGGGLSNGFIGSSLQNTTWMSGLRLKF